MKPTATDTDSPEISATEAGKRLGLTKQAIGLWCSKPGAPVRKDGTRLYIRWPDFARWREERLKENGSEKDEGSADAFRRRALADARNAEIAQARNELALARELGESIAVSDYGVALGAVLDRLVAHLRALAPRLSRFGPEVEEAIDAETERLIGELHEWDEDVLADPPEESDDQRDQAA